MANDKSVTSVSNLPRELDNSGLRFNNRLQIFRDIYNLQLAVHLAEERERANTVNNFIMRKLTLNQTQSENEITKERS